MEEIMKSGSQYVYMYWIDGIPRYVGNGKGKRLLDHLKKKTNEKLWKFIQSSSNVRYEIISSGTQEEMDVLERELIEKYGRLVDGTGSLCNFLSGGKKGWIVDGESKKKISNSCIGREGVWKDKFALSHVRTKQKYLQIHPITGKVIAEYFNHTLKEAGFHHSAVINVANGKLKLHKGFSWKIVSI